ncbi:MAG: glycosyltransferase family 2 protein [Terriglobia bacterium]|jgi:glycosyltransferase involved in cell wall biosynthesis
MDQRIERSYIIISPVKDEEKYIETTINAVIRQTVRPLRWIIVDDGSRDGTREILRRHCERFTWITTLEVNREGKKRGPSPVVRAFMSGLQLLSETEFDFIVKLDCDLDLPPYYFERLMAKFQDDDRLGIASGIYLERDGSGWQQVWMPDYHAAGASKMLLAQCYRQIGGFVLQPGWDTVDEIRARAMGWKTCSFKELAFHHLKPEGSAAGYLRTNVKCGEIDYLTGVGPSFFFLKSFHRMIVRKPRFLAGLGLMAGFMKGFLMRRPKLVSAHEARLYRRLLDQRMVEQIRGIGKKLRGRVWAKT